MPPDPVSDLVNDENTLLPECIINAGVWCCEVLESVLSWFVAVCTRASIWCQEKYSKYEREITIILKSISILMYILDLGTDLFTGIKHFSNQKLIAGSVTIIFSILPMLFLSFKLIIHTSLDSQNSINAKFLPSISAIVCSPILPLGWLVLDLVASISSVDSNTNNDNNNAISEATRFTAAKAARLVKLFVAVVESFPQATIQLFIVFGSLAVGENIELWQWGSIVVCLTSLSLSVSTGYLNAEAASSSKAIYFLFGLLAVTSRQVVCCVYSIHNPILWLVPFCTQLIISIIIWSITSMCQGQWTGLLIFVLTEAYNTFTLSGLLTSSIYLGFAVGAFFLFEVKQESQRVFNKLLTVTVVLAFVSLVFNFLFTIIPQCNGIRMDWMRKRGIDTIPPDAEGASTVATEIHPDVEEALAQFTETQPDTEEVPTYAPETQPDMEEVPTYTPETQPDIDADIIYSPEIQSVAKVVLTYDTETQPDAKGVLIYSSEHQPNGERVFTSATGTQPDTENTPTNANKIKPGDRQLLIDSKIALNDGVHSLKDIKESQKVDKETLYDEEKIQLNMTETRAELKETASDNEETHF